MLSLQLPLVLASGSPRRKELLTTMGLSYTIDVSEVDEAFEGAPEDAVAELSLRKAGAVAARHENAIILAADTLVYAGEVLGKPGTRENARRMLRHLSGNWHTVYSGVTLINTKTGKRLTRVDATRVHFVPLTEQEIEDYVATDDPLDKAGAYGVQGQGGMFVDRIEGSYSNVVGLPMSMLREMLLEMNK